MSDIETDAISAILREYAEASAKFAPFASAHEGIAVIEEESLELREEVFHGTTDRQFKEAVQLGAMALRFLIDIAAPVGRSQRSENQEDS